MFPPFLLSVAVENAAAVGADVDAAEDLRIACDRGVACAAPLVLVVVDAHPRLSCCRFAETDVVRLFDAKAQRGQRERKNSLLSLRLCVKTNPVFSGVLP